MAESARDYSYARYLAAKKTVDDRALNRHVWQRLHHAVSAHEGPLRIVDLGAGIGTMVERLVEWGLLAPAARDSPARAGAGPRVAHVTLVDNEPTFIAAAHARLAVWAAAAGFAVDAGEARLALRRPDLALTVELYADDALAFVAREAPAQPWDLMIASAFLGLVDTATALPGLFAALRPGGLAYFTINFDGDIVMEPAIERALDDEVVRLLCADMDARIGQHPGHLVSRTGRRLFHHVRAAGGDVLALGASDWVVAPGPAGYAADEAYFLHHLVHFIPGALADNPTLDRATVEAWVEQRHRQIDAAQLLYVSHQLDLLARVPGGAAEVPVPE
ncbi:MAG TPA: class I SAM-dependent methyltransferase [Chloroflexota bacterium]|jgi:hypothetical protein